MAVFMGIAPKVFLTPMERSVERVVQRMQTAAPAVSVRRIDAPTATAGAGLEVQNPGPRAPRVSEALSRVSPGPPKP
jgi:hypothetical protein